MQAAEIARLKRAIPRALAAKRWGEVERGVRELLELSPQDPDALNWQDALALGREEEQTSRRLVELRASIPQALAARQWSRADRDAAELLRLAPGDPEALSWRTQAAAGRAQDQPGPEPPAPAAKGSDDEGRVRNVIALYEQALEGLDVDRYARIWVSLDPAAQRRLKSSFSDLRSQTVDVQIQNIEVGGSSASVQLREKRTLSFKAGPGQSLDREMTMHLVKREDRWLIEKLETR
jgi:hypothetical protein